MTLQEHSLSLDWKGNFVFEAQDEIREGEEKEEEEDEEGEMEREEDEEARRKNGS